MSDEIGLRIVLWLILATGSLAITWTCLYASLLLFGRILKLLGLWDDTIKIMVIYFKQKQKRKREK